MLKRRIKRITIKNYRSITDLTVELEDLTVLVGANGSGKSNFVDVLRFLNLCMFSLDNALFKRGGINLLVNRVRTDDDISIEIVCEIDQAKYTYSFIIGKQNDNDYTFKKEFLKRENE
ncbi:MAG: AAA family ATPase, partial [Anaerolineae bacterium]|nr:AAA family ATPase [Anaerolineae bacterium]